MNASMMKNRVQLIGNLGQSPEIKHLENGNKMVRMSIATNERYKNAQGEFVSETQWHHVVAWGKIAEIAERLLSKGNEVVVEGKLMHRSYLDKEGTRKYITEIELQNILMLDKKGTLSKQG